MDFSKWPQKWHFWTRFQLLRKTHFLNVLSAKNPSKAKICAFITLDPTYTLHTHPVKSLRVHRAIWEKVEKQKSRLWAWKSDFYLFLASKITIWAQKSIPPTRIDFVFALPDMLGLCNHSERVLWTYLQKTIFFQLPNPNRKKFFQKIRKSWIFQFWLQKWHFWSRFSPCKKLTFWTF